MNNKKDEILESLHNILEHYYDLEKDHYDEWGKPSNHIFLDLCAVKVYMQSLSNDKNYD